MTRYFLTGLSVEGFRGINNENEPLVLTFRRDAINSIFAANGMGKSSVFEALSYAIRGSIPKLDQLPAADDPQAYYANRFHSAGKATIQLTLEPDDGGPPVAILVERSSTGARTVTSPSGFTNPEMLLQSLDTSVALLDHQTFDDFVETSPLKRGRVFSGLLGLGDLSEYRQAIEILSNAKSLKSDFRLESLEARHTTETQQADVALRSIRNAYLGFLGEPLTERPIDPALIASKAKAALESIPLAAPYVASFQFTDVSFKDIHAAVKEGEGVGGHLENS